MTVLARGLDVSKAPLCDITILGIEWLNDEKDIEFSLMMHSAYGEYPKYIKLLAEWATNVQISLDYGSKRIGAPFSWDFKLLMKKDGVYEALFDFGGSPDGYISFSRHEIRIIKQQG
jgi:hypothetical protein